VRLIIGMVFDRHFDLRASYLFNIEGLEKLNRKAF